MESLQDPIIITILSLVLVCGFVALRPRVHPHIWLLIISVLLFALPRAGLILPGISLPLPIAHILSAIFIIEWLIVRRTDQPGHMQFGRLFLVYAAIAGLGIAIGLSTGGMHLIAFMEFSFYLAAIGLFFFASETFTTRDHFLLFVRLILVVSVLVSIYGIAQRYVSANILINHLTYTSGTESGSVASVHSRVLSSYGDPNVLASQLIVFIGIAMAMVMSGSLPGHFRLVALGVLGINIWCVICTGSRGGLFCLGLVALVILIWRTRWALLILPVLAAVALFLGPQLITHVTHAVAARLPNVAGLSAGDIRMQFPSMAWQLLQIVPFGCGFGNTVVLNLQGLNWSFEVMPASVIWMGFNSFWLTLFSRLGVPGLIMFVLLLIVLLRYIWRQTRRVNDIFIQAVLVGALAGIIGQTVIWLANNTYMLPGGGLNFWFTLGMLVAGCRAFTAAPYPSLMPAPLPWSVATPTTGPYRTGNLVKG